MPTFIRKSEKPIYTNCCSGYKGCNYYSTNGTLFVKEHLIPKNPNSFPQYCDPEIAYSKCPHSKGKTIIYPTRCNTCCTGYKGCFYLVKMTSLSVKERVPNPRLGLKNVTKSCSHDLSF